MGNLILAIGPLVIFWIMATQLRNEPELSYMANKPAFWWALGAFAMVWMLVVFKPLMLSMRGILPDDGTMDSLVLVGAFAVGTFLAGFFVSLYLTITIEKRLRASAASKNA